MITLGGITISNNMYLGGVIEASQVAYKQDRTIEGMSKLVVVPTPGGRKITLESQQRSGAVQGIWCQSVIDAVKALEATGNTFTLDHHEDVYSVKIVDTTDFTPLFQYEPASPTKQYTGKITMIEV